jgi:hypothetical protein
MSLLHYRRVERRRTARASVCMQVLVCEEPRAEQKFKFWTRTVSVSAHGGVFLLEGPLEVGQRFQLMNEFNMRTVLARVVSVRKVGEQAHAAFEFIDNGENFWSMVFPASGAKPLRKLMPRVANGG